MLRPQDQLTCVFPGYQSLYKIVQHIGCKVPLGSLKTDGSFFFVVSATHFSLLASGHSSLSRYGKPGTAE